MNRVFSVDIGVEEEVECVAFVFPVIFFSSPESVLDRVRCLPELMLLSSGLLC